MLDVSVVIGRFQVPALTSGHLAILNAANKHAHMVVLVGVSGSITDRNPLDFITRRHMLATAFPQATILPVVDVPGDDKDWAKEVDETICAACGTHISVTFYGGRDSFWKSYEPYGMYKTYQAIYPVADEAWSGTTDRSIIAAGFSEMSEAYRRGVIYGVLSVLRQE